MRPISAILTSMALALACPVVGAGQTGGEPDVQFYLEAVGRFFDVGAEEVRILREWRLPAEELPVVLFVSVRAGISTDAVAANRLRGSSWSSIASTFGMPVADVHVEFGDGSPLGDLGSLYEQFASTPRSRWNTLRISDRDYVSLVNVRVLSGTLGLPPGRVLQAVEDHGGFIAAYRALGGG